MNRLAHCISILAIPTLALSVVLTTTGNGMAIEGDIRQMGPDTAKQTPEEYSPFVNQNFPDRVLWGATHIHTGLSADAGLTGVTLGPADMFRYARGEVVTIDSGLKVRLDRPLDWFAVTDHAEYMGLADQLRSGAPELVADPTGKKWYDMYKQGGQEALKATWQVMDSVFLNKAEIQIPQLTAAAWAQAYNAVEQFNDPGVFTTLHGFEWTSAPEGNNLHRTVIFRDGVDRVKQIIPFSSFDSANPEDLWKYMDRYEKLTGGQVLAIPHNGNLSNGLMFTEETYDHKPMDAAYAEARISHEPVIEVTQVKGDGETHPLLSPNDEFADFERYWDVGNIKGMPTPKQNWMLQYEYARAALKRGLKLEGELGVNPYAFGMVGASDQHTGVFSFRDDNYLGQFRFGEPSPGRWQMAIQKFADGKVATSVWMEQAAGLGAVWTRENTRRVDLGRSEAQGSLRHLGRSDCRARVRGLGLRSGGPRPLRLRQTRLRRGRADGRRSQQGAGRQEPGLHGPRLARSRRPQPRSRPDRQGLARQGRRNERARLRRGGLRRAHDWS